MDKLSSKDQEVWDTLSEETKIIILEKALPPKDRPLRTRTAHAAALDFIQSQCHLLRVHSTETSCGTTNDDDNPDNNSCSLLANAAKRRVPSSDIRRILSQTKKNVDTAITANTTDLVINGQRYTMATDTIDINEHNVVYNVSERSIRSSRNGGLIDRGANGCVFGDDVRPIMKTSQSVDIGGLDNHQITNIPIGSAGGVIKTQKGDVIAIFHEGAHNGHGKSILSCAQMEYYKADVNDKSIKVPGGCQCITTLDGYSIPLNIRAGLPYLPIRPYTDDDWQALPHVIMTSDVVWDPRVLDHDLDDDEQWFDAVSTLQDDPSTNLFDETGQYIKRVVAQTTTVRTVRFKEPEHLDSFHDTHAIADEDRVSSPDPRDAPSEIDDCVLYHIYDDLPDLVDRHAAYNAATAHLDVHKTSIKPRKPDYAKLRPFFGWLPEDIIEKTFAVTTQYAQMPMSTRLKTRFKSPFPALNVFRRNEAVATDTVYSDTPAIDSGATSAQFFVGKTSHLCDIYGMKSDKEFVNVLQDNITERGAPTKLISDRAQVEISKKIHDITRAYCIGVWQSEPHKQFQNFAEQKFGQVKTMVNGLMDRTGTPAFCWLLCLMYICFVLNSCALASLKGKTPLFVATGSTNNISPLLAFRWYQKVYYKIEEPGFPSESREGTGRFVGLANHVGHVMTFKVLTDDTHKILYWSNIRSAENPDEPNLRIDLLGGEISPPIVKSRQEEQNSSEEIDNDGETEKEPIHTFHPNDLVGRTFLMNPTEDGQTLRARIVEAIEKQDDDLSQDTAWKNFRISVNNDQYEEVLTYNEILEHIERKETTMRERYGSSNALLHMRAHSGIRIRTTTGPSTTS